MSQEPADDGAAEGDTQRARADAADLGHTQARLVSKLGLLLPGVVRVLDIQPLGSARWRVYLADSVDLPEAQTGSAVGPTAGSLRGYLCFDTEDLALVYQLRPRRLRLAVDLLELQRTGPESGTHQVR